MRPIPTVLLVSLLTACTGHSDTPPPPAPTEVRAVSTPPPQYPAEVACTGGEGTSVLRVVIGPTGHVTESSLITSSGHPALDEAAITAVAGWEFRAATRNGQPVPATIQVPVTFRLPAELPSDCFAIQERIRRRA